MNITELLEHYRQLRDQKNENQGEQSIEPPESCDETIQTLDTYVSRPISPLLKKRFEFCAAWKNAYLEQDWLSLREINNWESNKTIVEWVNLRKENSFSENEPFVKYPLKNIAVFSIDPDFPNETYLVWDDDNATEPKIWLYFDAEYYTFTNFERFLLYLNEKIGDEDTIRMDMTTEIRSFLPLQIDKIEYNSDILTIYGKDWKFTTQSAWRVSKNSDLLFACFDKNAEELVKELEKTSVIDIKWLISVQKADPSFLLSDGLRIDVFTSFSYDSWKIELPNGEIYCQ